VVRKCLGFEVLGSSIIGLVEVDLDHECHSGYTPRAIVEASKVLVT